MKKGFTLIELLIVIAIIAILALIAIPNFLEAQTRARVSRVLADHRSVATAIESYFVDYNAYPYRYEPGVSHSPMNYSGGLDRLSSLSTPIAYIASLMHADVFYAGKANDAFPTGYPWMTDNYDPASYQYYNFHGAHYESLYSPTEWAANGGNNGVKLPQTVRFNVPMAPGGTNDTYYGGFKTQPGFWALISRGPDRTFKEVKLGGPGGETVVSGFLFANSTNQNLRKGVHCTYDPTNGTISAGNIWRCGGQCSGSKNSN